MGRKPDTNYIEFLHKGFNKTTKGATVLKRAGNRKLIAEDIRSFRCL
jgi:hypothetical protein